VLQPTKRLERRLREALATSGGMREVWSYPWVPDKYLKASGLLGPALRLAHPPSPDMARLQISLVPQMLRMISENLRFFAGFRIFELNRIFRDEGWGPHHGSDPLPNQRKSLVGAVVSTDAAGAFLQAKGIVEQLAARVQMPALTFGAMDATPWSEAAGTLCILQDGRPVGTLGVVSARTSRASGIKGSFATLFELDVSALEAHVSRENAPIPTPRYPEVDFDLSMVVKKAVRWEAVQQVAAQADPLIRSAAFVDEYSGKGLDQHDKSLTLRLRIGSPHRTLVRDEIDGAAQKAIDALATSFDGVLRA
jgi:phenylalanyl-tRNA synthetase beta chain